MQHEQSETVDSQVVEDNLTIKKNESMIKQNTFFRTFMDSPREAVKIIVLCVFGALLFGCAAYLAIHPDLLWDAINHPYASIFVIAIPIAIGAVLLVLNFFSAIRQIVQLQIKRMRDRRDSFLFTIVIMCFMVMSVIESGPFFAEMLKNEFAGYFIVFVFDLSAVLFMNSRKIAIHHGNDTQAHLHMFGVIMTAGISGFANAYSSLLNYVTPTTGHVPEFMTHIAPWTGVVFPLLIIFIALTLEADLSNQSIVERYKTEQQTRLDLLKEKVIKTELINAELGRLEILNQKGSRLKSLFFTKNKINLVSDIVTQNIRKDVQQEVQTHLLSDVVRTVDTRLEEKIKDIQITPYNDTPIRSDVVTVSTKLEELQAAYIEKTQILDEKIRLYDEKIRIHDARIQQIAAVFNELKRSLPQLIETRVNEIHDPSQYEIVAERVFTRLIPNVTEELQRHIEAVPQQLQLPEKTVVVEEALEDAQDAMINEKKDEPEDELMWEVKRIDAKEAGYKASEKKCTIGSYTFAKFDLAATLLKSKRITSDTIQQMYDQRLIDSRYFRIVSTKGWGGKSYEHVLIVTHPDTQKLILQKLKLIK